MGWRLTGTSLDPLATCFPKRRPAVNTNMHQKQSAGTRVVATYARNTLVPVCHRCGGITISLLENVGYLGFEIDEAIDISGKIDI